MNLDLASLVAITSVFGLGVSMALLGSVKIRLSEALGIDDAQFGKLFSAYMFSNVVFVLVAGIFCDTLGYKTIAIIGYVAGAAAIFIFGQSKNYAMAMGACLLLGFGGMFMNTAGNVLLGDGAILFEDPGQSNNMGNVFFGVGAFFIPLIIVYLSKKMSLSGVTTIIAVIVLLPLIFALTAVFPDTNPGFSFADAASLIGQTQVILCALTLMCYIALECSMGGWITTYMTSVGADEEKAQKVLSIFWISIMCGRLFTALVVGQYFIVLGVDGAKFICGLAVVSAIILFYLTKVNDVGTATIAMIVTGLAFAPIFPTTIGLLFARTEQAFWGTGFSLIFAIGLVGAIFVPAWMGAISKGKDIKASMAVAAGTAVVLIVIAAIMIVALPVPLPPPAA